MKARRVLLAAMVAMLISLGLAGTAHAAGELGLSRDGVTWSATLPAPLFDPAFRWVPGDVETASFFVRNQSTDPGILNVTMKAATIEDLLATGDLTIEARVDGGAWTGVTTPGPHLLITDAAVSSGQVRKIDVRVSFDPASSNVSQTKRFDLAFDVVLNQGAIVAPPTTSPTASPGDGGDGNNGDNGGALPGTGSSITPALLVLAGLLCAAGLTMTALGRRTSTASKERQSSDA